MVQVSGLPALLWAKWKTPHWFVVLEMVSLHEGKEEGMTLDGGWEKTTFHPTVVVFSVCNAVLASNQFFLFALLCWHPTNFFVCIAVYGIQPVFCLYCCVGIQPVFLFVLLPWYPTSFFVCIAVLASNQLTAASSGGTHPGTVKKKEQPSPSISESRVSNFLCLLL